MVKIEKYDDLGQGICKIDNKVCFIKKAIPCEEVDVKITKVKKHYNEGIITNIIKSSQERVNPICPYYNKCGGCDFLHVTEEEEKKFKIDRCLRYFGKTNKFYDTNDNYREKVIIHIYNNQLGYYEEESNTIVSIDYCYLVDNTINNIITILKENLSKNDKGEILIRCNNKKEVLVAIKGKFSNIDKLKNTAIISNLIYNDKILKGNDYLYEEIEAYKFKVHYNSFFQVNKKGLESISKIFKEFFNKKKIGNVLDLYSGTGVLGILVSSLVKKVISVEMNKNATSDAKENIKLNNIANIEIIEGKVEDYINTFQNVHIDLVIVDPARRGLDKKTISYLNQIRTKYIIYISCNIHSLKRDLELLKENYIIDEVNIVDMFKRTTHVESIALLKSKWK